MPPSATARPERSGDGRPLVLAGILLLAVLLRLLFLGQENFWVDEVFQIERARRPFYYPLRLLQILPVGIALRIHESEFMARLPSAIFSTADVFALYLVGRRLVCERTALWGAAILAVTPIHVWYAQEARWYAQWSLLTTLGYYFLLRIFQSSKVRGWFGFAGITLLNLNTFVVTTVVLACQALSALMLALQRRRAISTVLKVGGVVAAGALVLWILAGPVILYTIGNPTGTVRPLRPVVFPYTYFATVTGFSVGPTVRELHELPRVARILSQHPEVLLYAVVFAPLILGSAWVVLRSRSPRPEILLPWAFGLPILVIVAAAVTGGTYNVRYAFPSVTGLSLVLACGLDAIPRAGWRFGARSVVAILFGFALANYYLDSRYDKEDVRGAVAAIRATQRTSEPLLWIGHLREPLSYYAADLEVVRLLRCDPDAGSAVTVPGRPLRPGESLWVAVGRDWDREAADCLPWLQRTRRITHREAFTGVQLFRLEPRRRQPARSSRP